MFYLKWIFLLSLCGFTNFSLASDKLSQYPGVVALFSKDSQHIGTGFFIQSDILATAFHVVENFESLIKEALFFKDPHKDTLHPVTGILALDMEYDLAVLKIEGYHSEVFYPVSFSDRQGGVSISEKVILPGFPKGQFDVIEGRVAESFNYTVSVNVAYKHSRKGSVAGISGGPVFSKEAYLKGVTILEEVAALEDKDILVIRFVSVEKLRDLLARPRLSCSTSFCIDEEKRKWYSQALEGDARSQFVVGYREYQYTNNDVIRLKELIPFILGNKDKKEIERVISEDLFKKFKRVAYWFREAAQQGHVESQYHFGEIYIHGQGVKKDLKKAAYWIKRAAWRGYIKAQFILSLMYADGDGVEKDLIQAVYWIRQAALQGHFEARYHLGNLYRKGIEGVVKQDLKEAVYWFEMVAKQGHVEAQIILSEIYVRGEGVEQDLKKSAYWYLEAAGQGHMKAQYNIGLMYANELGVEQDLKKSAYWYLEAAGQGHMKAQYNIGLMYANELGVEQDLKKSAYWFEEAGKQGHAEAQYYLGGMYFYGEEGGGYSRI